MLPIKEKALIGAILSMSIKNFRRELGLLYRRCRFALRGLRVRYSESGFLLIPSRLNSTSELSAALDIGSGPNPRNPFACDTSYGVDIRCTDEIKNVVGCRLGYEDLPFNDLYFDVVTAFDVLEHIPRNNLTDGEPSFPFIICMNEIWRVMKVGGIFYSETPCYPMPQSFQDPTHVNIMTEDTLKLYFCGDCWARIYGFKGSFILIEEFWNGFHYCCALQKTSDEPVFNLSHVQR